MIQGLPAHSIAFRDAREARRIVRAARSFILRHAGVRTERVCLGNSAVRVRPLPEFDRDNRVGRNAIFHPSLQYGFDIAFLRRLARSELPEEIHARSATAVLHTRDHVQPHEARWRTHILLDAAVVVDDVVRRNGCVAPAVIKNELSAAIAETLQIGVVRIQ